MVLHEGKYLVYQIRRQGIFCWIANQCFGCLVCLFFTCFWNYFHVVLLYCKYLYLMVTSASIQATGFIYSISTGWPSEPFPDSHIACVAKSVAIDIVSFFLCERWSRDFFCSVKMKKLKKKLQISCGDFEERRFFSAVFSFLPPFLFAKITHVGNNYRNLSILLPLDGSPCFPEHTHCRAMTNLMHLRAAEQHLVMTKGSLCEIQGTQPKPSWMDGISWQIYCLATPRLQSVEPKLQGWENYRLQQLRLPSDSLACGATSTSLSLNWHVWHLINQILRKKKRKNA